MAIKKSVLWILTCSTMLQVSFVFCQSRPRVELITYGQRAGSVAITKLPVYFLIKARLERPSNNEWRQMFGAFLDSDFSTYSLPILGRYIIVEDSVIFQPRFPFLAGENYKVKLNMAYINLYSDNQLNDIYKDLFEYQIKIPSRELPALNISAVYPSGDQLPENLLRFYLYFSNPMQHGVLQHIGIYSKNGEKVKNTFLDMGRELWSSNDQRLTIWLDPGRIKRDLTPNKSQGVPLTQGEQYILKIGSCIKDVYGQELDADFEKNFFVTESDRNKPNLKSWEIVSPELLTKNPVIISLGEPMDHSLLKSHLEILKGQEIMEGEIQLMDDETSLEFYPALPWESGDYKLRVNGRIEDIAGNNMLRLFDSDLSRGEEPNKENKYFFKTFFVH